MMGMLAIWVIVLAFVVLFGVLMYSFTRFDKLIHLEYQRYPDQWVMDGMPGGYFWQPPGIRGLWQFFKSFTARDRLVVGYVFMMPDWITIDEEARRYHRAFRQTMIAFCIGVPVWLCFPFIIN